MSGYRGIEVWSHILAKLGGPRNPTGFDDRENTTTSAFGPLLVPAAAVVTQ